MSKDMKREIKSRDASENDSLILYTSGIGRRRYFCRADEHDTETLIPVGTRILVETVQHKTISATVVSIDKRGDGSIKELGLQFCTDPNIPVTLWDLPGLTARIIQLPQSATILGFTLASSSRREKDAYRY
jgi:hypothetical protein